MFRSTLLSLLVFYMYLMGWTEGDTGCGKLQHTTRTGHFYYQIWNSSGENCNWTFTPPSNRSDVMLVINIPELDRYSDGHWRDELIMPDGEVLLHNTSSRAHRDTTKTWCGVYVREQHGVHRTCASDVIINDVCERTTAASMKWPPVLQSNSYYYFMFLSYAFLDCQTAVQEPSQTTTQATTSTSTATTTTTKQYETSTTSDLPNITGQMMSRLRNKLRTTTIASITMGAIAAVFALILIALVVKLFNNKSRGTEIPLSFKSNMYQGDQQQVVGYHNMALDLQNEQA
ncbi:uncharacterized protein LOC143461689 isoform X2 [Clavelina lepadiformis]|uniref:uncharacterized protein LOC143461689 isoform X2 n=1 Tax=Clavelina lepadiformis TaxID=159417 RepID=UPI0040438C1D